MTTKRFATLAMLLAFLIVLVAAVGSANARIRGCGTAAGYFVSANSNTSCAFARNTARAFARGARNPYVYSPVTGRTYHMFCGRSGFRRFTCAGGNNALVRLSY